MPHTCEGYFLSVRLHLKPCTFFQYLRCNKALHVGSPFAHEIYICQFCATKRGVFGDTVQMSKDSCFICGRFTPWKDDRYVAMVCNAHRPPRGPPNMKMCFVCQRPRQNNVKAHLCRFVVLGDSSIAPCLLENEFRDPCRMTIAVSRAYQSFLGGEGGGWTG